MASKSSGKSSVSHKISESSASSTAHARAKAETAKLKVSYAKLT